MTYSYSDKVKNRLKRVEGQVRGILRMMEEEKSCKDVITQLSAARTALDRSIAVIVAENLTQCVQENLKEGKQSDEDVQEAIDLLIKSR